MPDSKDPDYRVLRNAIRRLFQQPDLVLRLKSDETADKAMEELRIPSQDARVAILNILNDIEQHAVPNPPNPAAGNGTQDNKKDTSVEIDSAKAFFDAAFRQLERAYQTSIIMSVTMFVMGIGFLCLAAAQAIWRPENVATTSVVGGIGIVQIVALFYSSPLADIARAVSNAQQAKITITSYLVGITLLRDSIDFNKPSEKDIKSLLEITEKALIQLETYTEVGKNKTKDG